jgi:hypothetical protein
VTLVTASRCGLVPALACPGAGDRAIAVILSGSGSDGSRGVQEVSKAGGAVFCESPDTAQFTRMPLSAMRTGMVDNVLPPEEAALAAGFDEHLTKPPDPDRLDALLGPKVPRDARIP